MALTAIAAVGLPAELAEAAGTATATFQVTATVQATCNISATNLAFGTYAGAQTDATSTVTVTCTNTTAWNVGLNAGTCGATVTTRCMANGAAQLNYALYRDSARTQNWGQTVGTDTLTGTGNGAAQANTVYGRIPAGQFPAPGAYTDTITATVSF
ncbi:MAG: Sigma-fimbriae tip adhesin [Enhydrobacter sp.]|nr:MAG: Sigma-fimbriae tip adhesin [Enhydrobacter sp.]